MLFKATVSNNLQSLCSLLRHIFINQKIKCKDGGSYFYKNQIHRRLEREKIPNFLLMGFSENAKCFVGALF